MRLVVAALAVLPFAALPAQTAELPPVRIRWAAANALVYPDTMTGVRLWFATNTNALLGGKPVHGEVYDGFHPDSVTEWTVMTRQMLALDRPPGPWAADSVISSGMLRGRDGTMLLAVRHRDGERLRPGVRLAVISKDQKTVLPFVLGARELDTLLAALDVASPHARLRPRDSSSTSAASAAMVETPVAPHPSYHVPPRYPDEERRSNREGEVWTQFVVDTMGRVDRSSIRFRLSDGAGFERAVRQYLGNARYLPARLNGRAVRQQVHQRFAFALRR